MDNVEKSRQLVDNYKRALAYLNSVPKLTYDDFKHAIQLAGNPVPQSEIDQQWELARVTPQGPELLRHTYREAWEKGIEVFGRIARELPKIREAAGSVLEFTDANFAKEVDHGKGVCLVDFWAEWCAPCQMLAPKVKELADDYVGKARIGKLDTDAHRETAGRFGITAIPTLILFKDGEAVKRFVGMTAKDDLRAAIDEALGS